MLFNHFWIACSLVCNLCKAMPASLSVANSLVSWANVAVVILLRLCLQCIAGKQWHQDTA
jgi:hypothetical protein